jgi:signal transduction histidine kinase
VSNPDSIDADFARDLQWIAGISAVPKILDVVCRMTGMGFAAVARVTETRWIACAVKDDIGFGLHAGSELEIKTTICDEIRGHRQAVIIDHVAEDPLFRDHHTPKLYGLQSYISMPILRPNGEFFGTLCAIDPRPNQLNRPHVVEMFQLFADLISFHLDAQERLEQTQAALLDARQSAELRDQFIAVLGHDLRNPLASIDAGARMLRKSPIDARGSTVLDLMQNSVVRMAGLITNVLDFARGRLGGGLAVEQKVDPDFAAALDQVVDELRIAWPDRQILMDVDLSEPVRADTARIAQLFSNLLANALTHGAPDRPVRVRVANEGGQLTLSVANAGAPIPEAVRGKLFQPFSRGTGVGAPQGLGLGLYISAEITRAHGGELDMASDANETRFTFRMPQPA